MKLRITYPLLLVVFLSFLPGCPVEMKDMAVVDRAIPDPGTSNDACKPMHPMATISDCSPGTRGPSDNRARGIGDVVTVVISESATARRQAVTETNQDSAVSNSISDIAALLKYLQPALSGAELLGGESTSDFKGGGTTSRTEDLQAKVTGLVKHVYSNGNVFLEAQKFIKVNDEIHNLYVSGIARLADINGQNEVRSSRLASAQIVFDGKGVLTDTNKPGILNKVMKHINPFSAF
jgi:flagellar L-ring protein precursor FlgH